jgi:fibro-slime domain-containing protein
VESAVSFAEWFADDPRVNLSAGHDLVLTRDPEGVWEYLDDAFYPADGTLLGNEGEEHNDFFTYELRAWGTYDASAGQFVEFRGGDGMWLYINGLLVLDLGGTQTNVRQRFDLDRLGLEDGELLDVRVFWANRSQKGSTFRLRTNLDIQTALLGAGSSGPFD